MLLSWAEEKRYDGYEAIRRSSFELTSDQDMRTKFEGAASSQQTKGKDNFRRDQGAARAISSFIDPTLNWNDLEDLQQAAGDMKVILKGVQCWEDAVKAAEMGVDGVVLR
jgi:L-lactate dehydrogenase (cytochrome)